MKKQCARDLGRQTRFQSEIFRSHRKTAFTLFRCYKYYTFHFVLPKVSKTRPGT